MRVLVLVLVRVRVRDRVRARVDAARVRVEGALEEGVHLARVEAGRLGRKADDVALLVQRLEDGAEGGEGGRREAALDGEVDAVEAVLRLELCVPGPG